MALLKNDTGGETPYPGDEHLTPQQKRHKQMHIDKVRKLMNSHEFRFSMIPFSEYNNSRDANLYHPQSVVPYLIKDTVPGLTDSQTGSTKGDRSATSQQKEHQPSLFFKCYSDDIYEAILEDLRAHYIAISNQDLEDDEDDDEGMEVED